MLVAAGTGWTGRSKTLERNLVRKGHRDRPGLQRLGALPPWPHTTQQPSYSASWPSKRADAGFKREMANVWEKDKSPKEGSLHHIYSDQKACKRDGYSYCCTPMLLENCSVCIEIHSKDGQVL
ncbi:uncharacterized protein LOC102901314 [Prionailurus iriomotensis]